MSRNLYADFTEQIWNLLQWPLEYTQSWYLAGNCRQK